MSMSTHVYGFHPPDERWVKVKAIYDAYVAADLPVPEEVQKFFDWREPSELGVLIEIPPECRRGYYDGNGAQSGIEVILEKLPENITVIRFVNSW